MNAFQRPAATIGGLTITDVYDYKTHEIRALNRSEPPRPLPQPSGDLLIFHTERPGTRFAARPSGTEPKIKFYLFARTDVAGPDHLRPPRPRRPADSTRWRPISTNMWRKPWKRRNSISAWFECG